MQLNVPFRRVFRSAVARWPGHLRGFVTVPHSIIQVKGLLIGKEQHFSKEVIR